MIGVNWGGAPYKGSKYDTMVLFLHNCIVNSFLATNCRNGKTVVYVCAFLNQFFFNKFTIYD